MKPLPPHPCMECQQNDSSAWSGRHTRQQDPFLGSAGHLRRPWRCFLLVQQTRRVIKGDKSQLSTADTSMKSDSPGPRRHSPQVSSLSLSVRPRTSAAKNTGGRTPNGGCDLGSKSMPVRAANGSRTRPFNYGLNRHGAYPCPQTRLRQVT